MKTFGLLLTALALLALLTAACARQGEERGTPVATGTVAAPTAASATTGVALGVTSTEIILGQHLPLSGGLGAVYAQVPSAQQAYYRYVNEEKGGVCGRKIVLKVEDDAGDLARALEVTRKLVEQDHVFAMVGSLGDVNHGAVWDYLNENGVPDLFIIAGAPQVLL